MVVVLGLSFAKRVDAQTVEQLNAQANLQISLANLATAAGKNNIQVQMVEAEAKLIAAQATMVTAMAGANKTNAEALHGLEQARSLVLDNSLKKAETFYAKKAAHDNYKTLAKPRTRPTPEAMLHYRQASMPKPLTERELDPIGGQINWPLPLLEEKFSEDRIKFDALFASHLDYSNGTSEVNEISSKAKVLTKSMLAELRTMIREVPGYEYVNAKSFIRSLELEFQPERQEPGRTRRAGDNQLVSFAR